MISFCKKTNFIVENTDEYFDKIELHKNVPSFHS